MSWSPRFLIDQDVDVHVAHFLRALGYVVWTAGEIGLHDATDDELTVWAVDHGAALLSMDKAFAQRRRKYTIGVHVWLRCPDWEAAGVLAANLDDVLVQAARGNVVITVTNTHVVTHVLDIGPAVTTDLCGCAAGPSREQLSPLDPGPLAVPLEAVA